MGLFDGIKAMTAMVKGGIAVMKACDHMENVIQQGEKEYKRLYTPTNNSLSQSYAKAKKDCEATQEGSDTDAQNAANEALESAQLALVLSLQGNEKLPLEFRSECLAASKEYAAANEKAFGPIRDMLLKAASTSEEKAEIERTFQELEP